MKTNPTVHIKIHIKKSSLLIPAVFALMAMNASAVPRSYSGTPITENFDGLGTAGTSIALLTGWDAGHFTGTPSGGTNGNGLVTITDALVVDNGSHSNQTTSMLANFGTTSAADRALGSFVRTAGNGVGDQFLQLAIKNDSGSPITSFVLSYTGEQWQSGATAVQPLTVWYSDTSATSGFVSMSAFTFNSPNLSASGTALDGNAAGNRTVISATYTPASPIAAGGTFYIRWYDVNDAGSDDFLAIDDLTLTPALQISTVSTASGDWHTPATWNPASVPTSTSPVTVNTHAITITTATANCNSLTISGGGSVSATGQALTVSDGTVGALSTTGGTLALDGGSTLNIAKANTSASLAGLTVGSGTILNVTNELTVDASKDLSGTTINTPKVTLAGGTLTNTVALGIGSGGLISGNGTVAGTVAVATGGKASPGTDTTINTIATNGLSLASGSLLTLNAASTSSNDQLTVSTLDGLTINGGAITFLNGTGSGPVTDVGTYNLIAYSGTIGGAVSNLSIVNKVAGKGYTFGTAGGYVTLTIAQGAAWNGNSTNANWSDAANWSGVSPSTGDILPFVTAGAGGAILNNNLTGSYASLQFESGAPAFTLNGNSVTLTGDLSGNVVLNNSTNIQTINMPITLGGNGAINAANAQVVVNSNMIGTGNLTKSGSNQVTLTGTNSYVGSTTIAAGTLRLGDGTTDGTLPATTLANSGTLMMNNVNPLTFSPAISGTGSVNKPNVGTWTTTGVMGTQAAPIGQVILKQGATVIDTGGQLYTNNNFYVGQASGDNATLTLKGNAKLVSCNIQSFG